MTKVEWLNDTSAVYDIEVAKNSCFYADGILVHNCTEITLPTTPMGQEDEEIALCTLSATNWGKFKKPEDMQRSCELAVRGLDALLSYQDYPVPAAEKAKKRRALGVGIINFAYWMAKHDLSYQNIDERGLALIHEWAEAWSFYLIEASMKIAREFGQCEYFDATKYGAGLFPKDTYKRELDEIVKPVYKMDWDVLKNYVEKYGMRNSTLMAQMPAETSAQIANATNGVEPPRALVSIKQSKDGVLAQVVPEIRKLKNKYDLLWDQKSPVGYIKIMAVLQKFIDQSISVNTSYNPAHYPDDQVPMSDLLQHMLLSYRLGIKTLYYCNTNDGAGEITIELKSSEIVEEDCDSCKL